MDIVASTTDTELLKTIAICLCPLLLALCAWLIIRRIKEDSEKVDNATASALRTWDKVVEIDKNLAVVLRDVEYIVHDQKMQWNRLDELRAKLYEQH